MGISNWMTRNEGRIKEWCKESERHTTERYIVALPIARGLRKATALEERRERMKA
jgi:hypothetical protein